MGMACARGRAVWITGIRTPDRGRHGGQFGDLVASSYVKRSDPFSERRPRRASKPGAQHGGPHRGRTAENRIRSGRDNAQGFCIDRSASDDRRSECAPQTCQVKVIIPKTILAKMEGVVPSVVELAGGGLLGNGFYAAIPGCLKRAEGSSKASISRGMSRKPRTRRKRCSASSRAALTQRWIISPPRQRLTFRV